MLSVPFSLKSSDSASTDKVLILAVRPRFFSNFSTNQREYYYIVKPNDSETNRSQCLTPGLESQLAIQYPGYQRTVSLGSVCTGCNTAPTSLPFALYTTAGAPITQVVLSNLRIKIEADFENPDGTGGSCIGDSDCQRLGFDCCITGQCVKHGVIRPGVDISSMEFLQAQQDIQNQSSAIYNYRDLYFVCGTLVVPTATPLPTVDAQATAEANVVFKGELRDCLNPLKNELSVCTKRFPNASNFINSDIALATPFVTNIDDRNFATTYSGKFPAGTTGSFFDPTNITEITYSGEVLYRSRPTPEPGFPVPASPVTTALPGVEFDEFNDNLSDGTAVIITRTPSPGLSDDILKIKYKIDGSCEANPDSIFASCKKFYVQGQHTGEIDDHFPASTDFKLPFYADTSKNVLVSINDSEVDIGTEWSVVNGTEDKVVFIKQPSDGQKITIQFFVNLGLHPVISSKREAQIQTNKICGCADIDKCNFIEDTQTINGVSQIVDYKCLIPTPIGPEPPLLTIENMSAKAVPVRFFNSDGTAFEKPSTESGAQEGVAFEYTGGDPFKPNNVTTEVGFNEIYGSISIVANSAKPPIEVNIKKNKTYDIFVNTGRFSSCLSCGNDYYSSLARLFPENFAYQGAGYRPDPTKTRRFRDPASTNSDNYRADDLLFGRACFVPVPMIPWTHRERTDPQTQRRERLAAQHFLFANGYGRDWYGFDYGSVIGSFDGVNWFAIGSQRRIKSQSKKLYIAINAYVGDLTTEQNYQITIGEQDTIVSAGSFVTSNYENDGAECQKHHVCQTDSDCIGQLGWEYSCESITEVKTAWPTFDDNGQEEAGSAPQLRLLDLIGEKPGPSRRCVYRGRGAPCHESFTLNDDGLTYHGTANIAFNACNSNNYCESFDDALGVPNPKFNNKVVRYNAPVSDQNNSSEIPDSDKDDTFGLASRSMLRPFRYNGTDTVGPTAEGVLSTNKIRSICIPGKEVRRGFVSSVGTQHSLTPPTQSMGDKVLGIGMTRTETSFAEKDYVSSCSILDDEGNYFYLKNPDATLDDPTLVGLAGSQAISSNNLLLLQNGLNPLTGDFEANIIDEPLYQLNRCLRAPGSVCFSDFECAPNSFITDQTSNLDVSTLGDQINEFELKFWQEGLVCGQKAAKTSEDFDLSLNKCCRETGSTLTIASEILSPAIDDSDNFKIITQPLLPGIDIPVSTKTRNSRMAPVYQNMLADPVSYPQLVVAHKDACGSPEGCQTNEVPDATPTPGVPQTRHPDRQWKTFSTVAQRTCCSQNWVRNFSSTNGGGHLWAPEKMQSFDKTNFECLNWAVCDPFTEICNGRTCFSPSDPNCKQRAITNGEEKRINNFMGTLELIGVPQMLIKTNDAGFDPDLLGTESDHVTCVIDPDDLDALAPPTIPATGAKKPIPETIEPLPSDRSTAEFLNSSQPDQRYFAGHDLDNFINLKPVFSPDEISCCLPNGELAGEDVPGETCCSGRKVNGICCLADYTDLTVYYSRYVSGELSELNDALFDDKTGIIKDVNQLEQILIQENPCCSGQAPARGVAVSNLKVKGFPTNEENIRRFISSDGPEDSINGLNQSFDAGQRWNTHLYCVPEPTNN